MGDYRYTESGLDNVLIRGMNVFVDEDGGEEWITIANINALHRAIALGIIRRQTSMSGRELRFLRSEMGMTQATGRPCRACTSSDADHQPVGTGRGYH
ncbi:MAG: hypothetical protein FWD68_03435 [Alphaproteobacteria bacterium]|nr:hypothetical protein [Alphaproteobacteria bacterium]